MTLNINYIQEICGGFSDFIEKAVPNLTVKYILHHRGQRNDAIELESSFFDHHPAGTTALNILRKSKSTQHSAFHGLAVESTRRFFGLLRSRHMIGLITLNLDDYSSNEHVLQDAYHLGYHALDAAKLIQQPKYRSKLTRGPLIPKRSPLSLAKANMAADIFSTLVLAHQGYHTMIRSVAADRAINTMLPRAHGRPWHYPYPLAFETVEKAWNELIDVHSKKYQPILTPYEFAKNISATFNSEDIKQWWKFCEPAQEMAWYGENPEVIMAAALETSEDPLIKANCLLIKECLSLRPVPASKLDSLYNPFLKSDEQMEAHLAKIEETFEVILAQGIQKESSTPFMEAANLQNTGLMDGKVFGWCAAALQAAGRAFEQGLSLNRAAGQMAELEFKSNQKAVKFDALQELSKDIIKQRQTGSNVSLDQISTMIKGNPDLQDMDKSLHETMNAPSYKQALQAAREVAITNIPKGPAPVGPKVEAAPSVAPVAAPQYAPPSAAPPGMSGGAPMSGVPAQTAQQQTNTSPKKEETEKETK